MNRISAYLCTNREGRPSLELYNLDFLSVTALVEIMIMNGSDEIYGLRAEAGAHMSLGADSRQASIVMYGKSYQRFLEEMGRRLSFTPSHMDLCK